MKDKKRPITRVRLGNESPIHDTSGSAQRFRLLAQLRLGPVDTFTAMGALNICRPGARIAELRAAGHTIQTQRITMIDDHGREHHGIALYYLTSAMRGA